MLPHSNKQECEKRNETADSSPSEYNLEVALPLPPQTLARMWSYDSFSFKGCWELVLVGFSILKIERGGRDT